MTGVQVPPLGVLKRIDAREVWKHEALQFTPWLREHIGALADALQLELELPETEVPVGPFSCDVLAREVGTGRVVIVENQLEATDHSHLGQLLTYAAGLDARAIIWLSPQFREEHRQAVDWLNANTGEELAFFGVELELLQIDQSLPAPHFKVVAQPNDWQKAVKKQQTEIVPSAVSLAYQQIYEEFIQLHKQAYPHASCTSKAYPQNWLTVSSAGRSGFSYGLTFPKGGGWRVELYIDAGTKEINKAAFDELYEQRKEIEAEVGHPLSWERLDERRASRISALREGAQPTDQGATREQHLGWVVGMVGRFRTVFGPRVTKLNLTAPAQSLTE